VSPVRPTVGHLAATAAIACILALAAPPAGATVVPTRTVVLVDTTTTTTPDTTTTTVPVTTSTLPATTTTVSSTTTTTTTTSSTTTTTEPTTSTTVPATATSSKTPWGLIALVVVLVLAIVGLILLYLARSRKAAADAWRRRALPAISDARLARESLQSPSAVSSDHELRSAVGVQVDRASNALEHAATTAPDPAAGGSATTAAGALRGLAFAIEADRLLRQGAGAPTGIQLAEADQARRDRDAELQGALARLQAHVTPSSGKR
jgi:hypothetical protein